MVMAFAGRRIDAGGAEARFPLDAVERVAQQIRRMLDTRSATHVVASAACGADLLALREASSLGLKCRVVLPFARDEFRESSVVDRPGAWGPMFDELVDAAARAGDVITLNGNPS